MLFAKAFALALIPFAVASPLEARQSSDPTSRDPTVVALARVRTNCRTLNNTLNGFKKNDLLGFPKAVIIQNQANDIQVALENTVKAAKAQRGSYSDAVTGRIAGDVLDFEPEVASLLNNIVTHKPAFATSIFGFGDVSNTVLKDLQNLRGLVQQLGVVIPPKLTEPFNSLAPEILARLLGYFDTAIKAYQRCTGKVCLPPLNPLFPPLPGAGK